MNLFIRANGRVLSDLRANKDLLTATTDQLVVVRETIGEMTDATNYNDGEITKHVKSNSEQLSVVKASICATNALVVESLKVEPLFNKNFIFESQKLTATAFLL